jgi:hypothetical protein
VLALRIIGLRLFRKMRAIGTATWSYLAWLAMHPSPVHLHHAARALHVAVAMVRR